MPTTETLSKMRILDQKRYMGNIELENMIMDSMSKYGLLVNQSSASENPALIREAVRPSLITQHINFQSRKIWEREKKEKKNWRQKMKEEAVYNPAIQITYSSSDSSSSF